MLHCEPDTGRKGVVLACQGVLLMVNVVLVIRCSSIFSKSYSELFMTEVTFLV